MPETIVVNKADLQAMIRENFGAAKAEAREEVLAIMNEKIEKAMGSRGSAPEAEARRRALEEARAELDGRREEGVDRTVIARLEKESKELREQLDKIRKDPNPETRNAQGIDTDPSKVRFADTEALEKRVAFLDMSSQHLRGRQEARRARKLAIKRGDGGDLALFAIGLAHHRNLKDTVSWLRETGYQAVAQRFEEANDAQKLANLRALNTLTLAKGAVLVPEPAVAEFVELLYAKTAVRQLGVRSVPMQGKVNIGRMATGVTASWGDESSAENASEPTFGASELIAHKLKIFVPISNDLVRRATPDVVSLVERHMLNAARVEEDKKFLRGDGTVKTPKGLLNLVNSSNLFNANGTINLQNVTSDLGKAVRLVEEANIDVPEDDGGWIFAPRSKWYLKTVRDTNGGKGFPEMDMGMLMTYPFVSTTQVPRNLGGGSDESEVYFIAASQFLIGDEINMQIDASQEASYKDSSGTTQSSFNNDETITRLIHESDFAALRTTGASIIQVVKWT
jgi:HK97 family phage major capsid protein